MIDEVKQIKGEIKTPLGRMSASFTDKLNTGEKINSSSIAGGVYVGSAKIGGKEIEVISCGMTLALTHDGRAFYFDLKALIHHAVDSGFLDENLIFEQV